MLLRHNSPAPVSQYTGVPGWETPEEQRLLMQLAAAVPTDGVIVEIGAEFGMSASLFCASAPETAQIYSVDLFPDELLKTHRKNLLEAGFGEGQMTRSMQITGDSREICKKWDLGQINLLFVDGDHSFECVFADLVGWTPHLHPDGVVALHDVMPNSRNHYLHEEVTRALETWLAKERGEEREWELVASADSVRAFARKGVKPLNRADSATVQG